MNVTAISQPEGAGPARSARPQRAAARSAARSADRSLGCGWMKHKWQIVTLSGFFIHSPGSATGCAQSFESRQTGSSRLCKSGVESLRSGFFESLSAAAKRGSEPVRRGRAFRRRPERREPLRRRAERCDPPVCCTCRRGLLFLTDSTWR